MPPGSLVKIGSVVYAHVRLNYLLQTAIAFQKKLPSCDVWDGLFGVDPDISRSLEVFERRRSPSQTSQAREADY
ncbi:hypothetical protein FM036_08730 [Nostoc sp. HG1]|nr:hypothetical protein [Nostoc sp. HG1]